MNITLLDRFRRTQAEYPRQFWLLFWGLLISTTGSSMIWPFLMIYVSEKLALPLAAVASLLTLNASMGLAASFIAGPLTDRVGRKWVMVVSLAMNGIINIFMSQASNLPTFAVLMALTGAINPLYRVGADAMMADLISPEKRIDAYSMLRLSNNLGVSIGPAMGGFVAGASYTVAFYCAATGMLIYSFLVMVMAAETLPKEAAQLARQKAEPLAGYGTILSDKRFMPFVGAFTLTMITSAMVWTLLSVYTKVNYHLPEALFGFIPTTNALMVVFLQIRVTQVSKRYPPLKALAFGSLFYAIGVGSLALGRGFWGFWTGMVIITLGELVMVPTASTLTANLAPPDMRGRYMSIYGLTWGVASGIGPVLGGFLNDTIAPVSIWFGGLLIGLIATLSFLWISRRSMMPAESLGD
jgi:MFS family permease